MKNFKSNLKQTVRAFPLLVVMLLCSSAVLAVPGWSNTNMTSRQSTADELTDRQVSSAWQPTYQGYSSQIFEVGTTNVPSDYSEVSSGSSEEQGGHKGHLRKLGGGTDVGEQSELSPIGESWIMLLFALLACGVIAYRKMNFRHNKNMKNTILNQLFSSCKKWKTLVLIGMLLTLGVGQTWGYTLYLYTGSFTDWEGSSAGFRVWTGSENVNFTSLGNHWWSCTTTRTGTMYIKRTDSGHSSDWNEFTASSVSSTNNVFYVSDWNAGGQLKYYIKHPWNGGSWTWQTMTFNSANTFKYTGIYKSGNGANVNQDKGDSNYLTPSNASNVNDKVPAIWTYTPSSNSLRIDPAYTLTVNAGSNGSASGSQAKGIKMSTKYAISATANTGYHFNKWTRVSGGTCTFDNASDASTNVTVTGDASATVQASFEVNTYTVAYNANDDQYPGTASGSTTSSSHTYGTAKNLTSNGFSRTGYIFAGWATTPTGDVEYTNGQSVTNLSSTQDATVTLYAKWTAITLSATISPSTINANTATAIQFSITTNAPLSSGYYYEISNWGGKNSGTAGAYNIDGDHQITSASPFTYNLAASLTNLDAGTYKIKLKITKNAVTQVESDLLTLTVSSSTYTVTVGASPAGYGTVSPASISASPDSWSGNITATPNAGYQFVNWTSSGGGITINGNTANPTQIKATSTGGTLTANFSAATYRVTLDNQDATSAGTPYVDAIYNTTTLTTIITKPTKTNYTFGGYYTATGGGGIQIIDANGNWLANKSGFTDSNKKSIITEDKILYAKWTETTYAVTVAVDEASHAAGNIDCSAAGWTPGKSGTAQIGNLTNVTITVPAGAAGYTYTGGSWTLTGGVTLVSGSVTSPSITVKATAAGSAIFTYAEDLSSTYYVEGDASGPFTYGWNATENTMMKKRSGSSTSSDVYWELEVPSSKTSPGDTQWEFKIYNSAGANNNEKWLGWGTGSNYYWLTQENHSLTLSTSGSNNIRFKPYVEGTYIFHVNYSTPASPTLEVTWPVVNQLRVSAANPADATNTGNFDLVEGSSNDWSVSRTLNANTTYTFKMVYEGAWYGKNSTALTRASNTASSLSTSGADMTVKTDVAGSYTFTFNSSTKNLEVTYPLAYQVIYDANSATSGEIPAVSGTYYAPASDVTLANNYDGILYKEGYAFNGWNTAATPSGSSTHYASGGTLANITANKILYAEWVRNDYTMYFYNKDSWSPMTAYLLASNNDREKAWGGRAMTVHQGNVYKIDYNHSVQQTVIFNNNATGDAERKTSDLTIADGQTGDNWFYNDADKDVNTGGIHHGWSQYILVANFPTSTVAAVVGEKVTVVPTVVWADGINFADINITSTRASGSENINAVVSGTNIIVSGSEAGTATFNITYTYSTHSEATITKTLTVKVMNGLTIQAKIPSTDDHWVYSNIVKMHYWGGAGTNANPSFEGDVTMSWIKDVADGKYYQACVPVGTETTPKTNFIFFYDNFNDAWRKTQDVTNVTENSCYTINHTAGLDKQRNAVKEGTGLCNDSWNIQITMGSGDIYTSNIVETSDEIVSFFAPGASESQSYRQGVVTIEHNGASVATVPASTFAASGVYTAKINTTTPALTDVALYDGNYYIRTDGADGGWDNYKTNPDNLMTEFTRNTNFPNETFSYYWVKNVAKNETKNIKATVANDYNPVLCNITADETANEPDGVNLRFGYEPTTNDIVRGIIGGATTNNFLNITCADGSLVYKEIDCTTLLDETRYSSNPGDSKFQDKSNWVYEIIVYAKIDDTHPVSNVVLKSYYYGIHYLLGMVKDAYGRETSTPVSFPVIKTGTTPGVYGLRVVYDFKTNRLFAAWAPADRVIDGVLDVDADVMFLRHEDGDAAQISFKTTSSEIVDIKQAIFALELDNEKGSNIERHYFISLPFDCKVSNIFGIGGFMNYWGIQRYNGAKRAQIGWFQETPTFWEWLSADDVMQAGEGYLLSVDKKALQNDGVWKEGIVYQKQETIIDPATGKPYKAVDGTDSVAWVTYTDGSLLTMYFPSTTSGFTITPATGEALTITYPDQPCSITRDDRDKKDSNWKCIGTPGYKNITIDDYTQASPELVVNAAPRFLYEFHEQTSGATWAKGTYTVTDGSAFTYHSFHSYMVQFAGTIDWAQYSKGDVASPIAPKRMPTADTKTTKVEIELLSSDDDALDRTFVWLQENATTGFDQNYDLNKMIEKKANQIYSLAENEVPFAANVLPLGTDTVPLVVNIANEGEYTFSLNVDKHVGMAPVLYDMYKSEQINLLTTNYAVELEKGKYEDRFFLLFQPEAPIVTSFETTNDGGQNVRSDETIYDVLGRRVSTIYPGHLYIVNGEKRIAK